MANVNDEVDIYLADLFASERGKVGLEVGVDPGLSKSEYIHIPKLTSKSKEYIIVDDPIAFHPSSDAFFEFAKRYHSNAWTAAAAKTTSWRRSNHATGAEIATEFPKRWLMKEGYWDSDQGKATRIQKQKNATSAFYIATHAVSVHSVLALMVPATKVHWAYIDPSFGCITSWDVRASTTVRMVPNS
ncbi:unnamed protein product, partial [Didymodactylos carnosus]